VDPGDRVARGDTLLVLDVEDFELELRAAQSRLRAAESQLHQAQDDERRYSLLAANGAAAERTSELASTSLHVAQAEAAAARAEASEIENRRNYSTLRADGEGVITEVLVERGQVVSEGQIVVRFAHDGAREAVIDIPETQLPRASSRARAFAFGDSKHVVDAALRELSAAADPVTRTFRARYVLADDGSSFPIGSTVTVRLASDGAGDLSRVPIGALHDPGDGVGVWRIEADRRVRFAPVRVVELAQEYASVASGVAVGDSVVALGAHLLHEGDLVRPVGDGAGEPLDR
jgi:RND family efflux transporter MFP subunit